jgi:hypothetical protein
MKAEFSVLTVTDLSCASLDLLSSPVYTFTIGDHVVMRNAAGTAACTHSALVELSNIYNEPQQRASDCVGDVMEPYIVEVPAKQSCYI